MTARKTALFEPHGRTNCPGCGKFLKWMPRWKAFICRDVMCPAFGNYYPALNPGVSGEGDS